MSDGGARRFRSRLGVAEGVLMFCVFGVLAGGGLVVGWAVARDDQLLRAEQNLGTSALWTGLAILVGTGLFALASARRSVEVTPSEVVERRFGTRVWPRADITGLELVNAGYGQLGLPLAQPSLVVLDEIVPLKALGWFVFNRRADDVARERARLLADALDVPLTDRLDELDQT